MTEKKSFLISVFWVIVIFNLDPGGFMHMYIPPIGRTLFSFASLGIAYGIFNFYYINSEVNLFKLRFVKAYAVFIVIWSVYFFSIYYGYNNDQFPGIAKMFLLNPDAIFKSLIVFPIVFFSIFSINTFVRILVYSTIVIGFLFIVSVITGVPIIETWSADRNTGGVSRNFMYGYGLMYFTIPLAIAMMFLDFGKNNKILLASVVSFFTIILTVFRRDIIGVIEFVVIVSVLVNFIQKKNIFKSIYKYVNVKSIVLVSVVFFLMTVFASNALEKAGTVTMSTLAAIGIVEDDKLKSGTDNTRMSLSAKLGIVKAIEENFYTGTGYDSAWMTGDGGDNKWEGSDYIFLAAFAMYGIIGLIIFLPFYLIAFKCIRFLLTMIKANYVIFLNYKTDFWVPLIVGIAASAEIIKNVIEYPNWFYPIGAISNSSKYFVFFALLIGILNKIEMKINQIEHR